MALHSFLSSSVWLSLALVATLTGILGGILLTGDEDLVSRLPFVSRVPFRLGVCLFLVVLLNLLVLSFYGMSVVSY